MDKPSCPKCGWNNTINYETRRIFSTAIDPSEENRRKRKWKCMLCLHVFYREAGEKQREVIYTGKTKCYFCRGHAKEYIYSDQKTDIQVDCERCGIPYRISGSQEMMHKLLHLSRKEKLKCRQFLISWKHEENFLFNTINIDIVKKLGTSKPQDWLEV